MRVFCCCVCGFFVLFVVLMLASGGFKLATSFSRDNVMFALVHATAGLMFLGAWWTTRKVSPYRNPWAMAASHICIATGAYIGWAAHLRGSFSQSAWCSTVLGLAGLYLFSHGGRAPRASPVTTSGD